MTLIQPPVDSWNLDDLIDVRFMLIEFKVSELLIYFEKIVTKIPERTLILAP